MAAETPIDPVTGVLPRATMTRRLDDELGQAARTTGRMSVFLFDVDFFKTVNDVYGHLRGDLVLRQLCEVVTAAVRETDVLFRYGGDEFVVLLPDTSRADAVQLAVRVIEAVKNAQFSGEPVLHLSVSLGVASYPEDGADQATLLACADRRNYLAKHRGRGTAVADDVDTAADAGSSRLWERDSAVAATHDFLTRVQTTGRGALRLTGQPGAGYTRFLAEVDRLARMRGFVVCPVGPGSDPPPVRPGIRLLLLADCDAAARVAEVAAETAAGGATAPEVLAVVYAAAAGSSAPPPDLPELAVVELSPWSPATLRIWLRSALQGEPSRTLVSWIARQSGGLPATAAAELDRLRQRRGVVPVGTGGWTVDPAGLRRSRRQVRLPAAMTRLIGREPELRQIAGLVRENRLVTLVGAGGIGKTRLSLAAAAAVADQFDDGVAFVPLDTCTNEDLVIAAIALALRVDEVPGEDLLETVLGHLAEASILLLLDNFEQTLSAAPLIGEMLSAVATLQVLITSREPLDLYGEQVYAVPPLALPDISALPPGDAGVVQARRDSPALALFEQRARNAVVDFALSAETLPVVAALCRRLDGLPLAIELAAAQIDRMDPAALLEHLGRHLSTLGAGPSNRPERQQTLRGALEWSYALLDAGQQRDFAALSVFQGGCTAEAAAAVAELTGHPSRPAGSPPDQDDWLEHATRRLDLLVRKSLLALDVQDDGERRYRMLETIRAYATTMLASRHAADTVHNRHAAYYAGLAERAATGLESPDQVRWVERLERDYPNLRSAVSWALDTADVAGARQICHGLWRYWRRGSHLAEGRDWLDRVLAMSDQMTANERARLLYPAAVLAATQDDHETATRLGWQGLQLAESSDDLPAVAQARNVLGAAALAAGQYDAAAEHFRQSLDICRKTGETRGTTIAMGNLAKLSLRIGAIDQAGEYIEQCLALERAAGNSGGILLGLECQGDILLAQGQPAEARRVLAESLSLSRDLGDLFGEAMARHQLGSVAAAEDDRPEALGHYLAAIRLRYEVEDREGLAVSLECVADLIVDGEPEIAVRLLAVADVLRERHRLPVPPEQEPRRDRVGRRARIRLGDLTFTAAGQAGRAAPLELVLDQLHDLHGG